MLSSCFNAFSSFRGGFNGFGGPGMFRDINPMWMMGFGLLRLLILGLIIYLVIRYLVPKLRRTEPAPHAYGASSGGAGPISHGAADSALAILNERYAKGDIDSETYQTMKENLMK